MALVHLLKINAVGPAVASRKIFKQKNIKKPPQQRVAQNKIFHSTPFGGKFFLNTAYEYLKTYNRHIFLLLFYSY
jgi:hypothetical protein